MNILGINEGHMSSACLLKDGKIVAAVSEERFTRNKNEQGFPKNAVNYCLKAGNISKNEIDYVANASNELDPIFEATKRYSKFKINDYIKENNDYWKPVLLENKKINYFDVFDEEENPYYDFSFLHKSSNESGQVESENLTQQFKEQRINNIVKQFGINKNKIIFVDHHSGHASYAYFMSPFRNNVLILTADAWGDGCNGTISMGNGTKIETKFRTTNNDLARIYRYVTLILGMKPNEHEYKVMGLAPYSTEYQLKEPYEIFKNTLYIDDLEFKYKEKPTDNYYWFKEKLEGLRFDGIAGGLQKFVEEIFSTWVKNTLEKFHCSTVVLSGGLALNIKINKKISELHLVENIFVPGGGGDESQSIGAALYVQSQLTPINFRPPLHDYHGPSISDDKTVLSKANLDDFTLRENISNKEIAEYLQNNHIVARCKGKSEFGPRALGNRSILANPSEIKNVKKINEQIKYRDFWMPFTPSILHERIDDYVLNPKHLISPYMTMAFESTTLARKHLAGAVHPADFTVRPQFLQKNHNPDYHDLISEFEKLTDIGGLLNTSLNLHGEPVVGNTSDALHTLFSSELDLMIINNNALIRKTTRK
jgi:carbamoyltransferase